MYTHSLKNIILFAFSLLILFYSQQTFSQRSNPPAPAENEEKKKGKSETLPEWVDVQNRLSQLETKIGMKHENIKKLIKDKHALPSGSPQLKNLIKELVTEHKELQILTEDYVKIVTIFKYRYPERGARPDRTYKPAEVKSLDEMEQELGIDDKLSRNQKKIKMLYTPHPAPSHSEKESEVIPVEKSKENTSPIILRK